MQKELDEATIKLEQYQHQIQRLENRVRDQQDSTRKKRNHRLITRGGAVESIAPEVRGMSERTFFLLMEQVFSLSEVAALVRRVPKELDTSDGAGVCAANRMTDQREGG